MHRVLNSHTQRHHSVVEERGTATPKESMTLDVQVNISKAAKFTIAFQLPCPPTTTSSLKALNHNVNGGDLSGGHWYMVVYFPSVLKHSRRA